MVNIQGIEAVFGKSGRTLILPLDHNYNIAQDVSTVPGIDDHVLLASILGVNAVLAHGDVMVKHATTLEQLGKIQQINAGLPHSTARITTRSVAEAYDNGADMFGIQFNLGSAEESQTFRDVEAQAKECERLRLPFKMFAHVYLRRMAGQEVDDFSDIDSETYGHLMESGLNRVISSGARIVKVAFRDKETFQRSVECAHGQGTPIPIMMAGGKLVSLPHFLETAITAIKECGADGLVVGTNVWGRPMDNDRPPFDIASFGDPPLDYEPTDIFSGRYICPDDEVTALLALRAVVHQHASSVAEAFGSVIRSTSIPMTTNRP